MVRIKETLNGARTPNSAHKTNAAHRTIRNK